MGFAAWRRLLTTYLRPYRGLVAVLAAALFTSIGLQVATPQLVRTFIDRVTSPQADGLRTLAALYIGAALLQQGVRVVTVWLTELVGWLTTNALRADLMAHCLALDPAFHRTHSPGVLIERVDGDVTGLSMFFSQFLLNVVGNTLLLIGVLVVVSVQEPVAGGVLTVFAVVVVLVLLSVRRVAAPAWERARAASGELFGFVEERLAGTEDIRSSGAVLHTLRGFYDRARRRTWATSHARVMDAITWSTNSIIRASALAISFVLPAVLVQRGEITVGAAFVVYFYAQLLVQPLTNMSHQVEQLQQAIAGARRVVELFDVTSVVVDGDRTELPAGPLAVSFGGVTFGYDDDPPVLRDVSFDVPEGSVLGIVGRTGSGKSSLAKLLVRLHDVRDGTIDVGGVDVRRLARHTLREHVALVTQEVHVLRASVRDNVTLFDSSVDDAAVLGALDRLGLGQWLRNLPDGLDTVIGGAGSGMSAGEAQLLAFARTFLRAPGVVVLDEASSRLDPATETVLEAGVDALLDGQTGIVIAHRLATLERCDSILVLEAGQVVEHGDRRDLADDPASRYAALLAAGLDVVPT